MGMFASRQGPNRGLSLRHRFLVVFLLIFVGAAAATYGAVVWISRDVVNTLLGWYAEKNVLYEKSKVFEVFLPEVALARKMASSPLLKEWVEAETNPGLRARAVAELEDYRVFFRSKSYFFAIADSGNYYFNDGRSGHDVLQPRYTLRDSIPKDEWFYSTLRHVEDYELNVDTDRHLGVTKVWINTVVKVGKQPRAVIGTGVDLSDVIQSVVRNASPGIVNMLLDRGGAIQAHQDVSRIDFASIARQARDERQSTIFDLIDGAREGTTLRAAFDELSSSAQGTRVLSLPIQGQRYMAGVTYLPELKWFLVTLSPPDLAQQGHYGAMLGAVLVGALMLTLVLAGIAFDRLVLRRLARLDEMVLRIASGKHEVLPEEDRADELGRLGHALREMAGKMRGHTVDLERQIAERTAVLERLASTDSLTGLLNRRGVIERMEAEKNRLERQRGRLGVMMLDLDYFKSINDQHGHRFGDLALAGAANSIRGAVRSYDLCARWGGEEFLVVIPGVSQIEALAASAENLRNRVRSSPIEAGAAKAELTVSIGCYLADAAEDIDSMIKAADDALYQAKQQGRDRVVVAGIREPDCGQQGK